MHKAINNPKNKEISLYSDDIKPIAMYAYNKAVGVLNFIFLLFLIDSLIKTAAANTYAAGINKIDSINNKNGVGSVLLFANSVTCLPVIS